MKKRWYFVIFLSSIIVGFVLVVIFADPGWRIELYDAGDGSMDQEVVSMGEVTFQLGYDGSPQFDSYWNKPGSEVLIKDSLIFNDTTYQPGDRLAVDNEGKLVEEGFLNILINDIIFFAWKLKNPSEHEPTTIFIRAEETQLRLSLNENSVEALKLKFGIEALTIDKSGDWIKIISKEPKMRGWIHKSVATDSKEQIVFLKKQNRIPKLIMLFEVNNNDELKGTTLAGYYTVTYTTDGKTESRFNPNDCIIFDSYNATKIPKPFTLTGGYLIDDPKVHKIYMLDTTGIFVAYDIVTFK